MQIYLKLDKLTFFLEANARLWVTVKQATSVNENICMHLSGIVYVCTYIYLSFCQYTATQFVRYVKQMTQLLRIKIKLSQLQILFKKCICGNSCVTYISRVITYDSIQNRNIPVRQKSKYIFYIEAEILDIFFFYQQPATTS